METNKPEDNTKLLAEAQQKAKLNTNFKALSFSIQFGLMIVIPLVVFALAGKWLAGKYENEGYYYGGLVLAILTSAIWFYRKINDLYKDFVHHDKDSDK